MLIDVSYFINGPRHILNASVADTPKQDSVAVNAHITGYINAYEMEFLRNVLGEELAEEVSEESKGVEVNLSIAELCEYLKEPLADYVFYHILRDAGEQVTATGVVNLKSANEYVSPLRAQVATWNTMVSKLERFIKWVKSDECEYTITIAPHMLKTINNLNI